MMQFNNDLIQLNAFDEILPQIKDKIDQIRNEYFTYLGCLKDEQFEEMLNETEDVAIKRAEGIYDRLDEIVQRNQFIMKNGKETIDLIGVVKNKIEGIVKCCKNDELILENKNNELIDKIIDLEERIKDKEIDSLFNQIHLINQKFDNTKNEWDSHRLNYEEYKRKKQEEEIRNNDEILRIEEEEKIRRMKTLLNSQEIGQIEEWTGMKIGNVLFDSDVDDWNENTSVFDQKVINKSHLIFLIEDGRNNLFGSYINAEIDRINYWIEDYLGFVFSLKSNGRINRMLKCEAYNFKYEFIVCPKQNNILFSIGGGNEDVERDIRICKENTKSQSFCSQLSFNYNGNKKVLCGKTYPQTFKPKRIMVIQLV